MTGDVVVEIRGGCLVGIYSAYREQRIILLDWDDLNEMPERERAGGVFPGDSFAEMPCDTRRAYERSFSGGRRQRQ